MQFQPKDSRSYFMLPQAPADAGYYVYGKLHGVPSNGVSQFAHPSLITAILRVEREWSHIDNRKFGIGDISLAGGVDHPDHSSHETGLDVDVRPIRKDGRHKPVSWRDQQYDFEATAKLIELFHVYANVKVLYFNDSRIPFAVRWPHHEDHFHATVWG